MWSSLLSAALAAPLQVGLSAGAWGVLNPATTIDVIAPEVGLTASWKKLQLSLVDHVFFTIAGPDHLYGLDVRARLPLGEAKLRPYLAPGVGVYLGGPLPVLPVGRLEGGLLYETGHVWLQGGLDAMGSIRAVGVGPRLTFGWSIG